MLMFSWPSDTFRTGSLICAALITVIVVAAVDPNDDIDTYASGPVGVSGVAAYNGTGTAAEYIAGIRLGNTNPVPIAIKGMSGEGNATISLGHYW